MCCLGRGGGRANITGTQPLETTNDLSREMVAGIDKFLMRETTAALSRRSNYWRRDFSSSAAYEKSVAENRERFRTIIGAVDERLPVTALEFVSSTSQSSLVVETDGYAVHAVRWPVFPGVHGEGLPLLKSAQSPGGGVAGRRSNSGNVVGPRARVPAISQCGRRLAEGGCEVLINLNRPARHVVGQRPRLRRFTNQPHREWIYRQAFEMGRHVIPGTRWRRCRVLWITWHAMASPWA